MTDVIAGILQSWLHRHSQESAPACSIVRAVSAISEAERARTVVIHPGLGERGHDGAANASPSAGGDSSLSCKL